MKTITIKSQKDFDKLMDKSGNVCVKANLDIYCDIRTNGGDILTAGGDILTDEGDIAREEVEMKKFTMPDIKKVKKSLKKSGYSIRLIKEIIDGLKTLEEK